MPYRIEVEETAGTLRIRFQGLLDGAALAELAATARRGRPGGDVSLVLDAGTEVDPECVDPLRALEGVTVLPVSAFLARWLTTR